MTAPGDTLVSVSDPILIKVDATTYEAVCDECVAEKNRPGTDRAWSPGEGHEDVTVKGDIPADVDDLWVECPHGHRHLVLRAGSERAANFGVG